MVATFRTAIILTEEAFVLILTQYQSAALHINNPPRESYSNKRAYYLEYCTYRSVSSKVLWQEHRQHKRHQRTKRHRCHTPHHYVGCLGLKRHFVLTISLVHITQFAYVYRFLFGFFCLTAFQQVFYSECLFGTKAHHSLCTNSNCSIKTLVSSVFTQYPCTIGRVVVL